MSVVCAVVRVVQVCGCVSVGGGQRCVFLKWCVVCCWRVVVCVSLCVGLFRVAMVVLVLIRVFQWVCCVGMVGVL